MHYRGLSWTYDHYGNRTAQTVTAGTAPANSLLMDTANNNRLASPYLYDANGNLKVEPLTISNNYTYNAENQMVNFVSGSTSVTHGYDGNGLRVKKVSGSTTTVYVFSGSKVIAEYLNGTLNKEYVYSGSALLATIAGGATTYHHSDQMSVRLSTNSSGAKAGEQGHFPFGESWYAANTTTKWQFTSYERDAESGNDYAMARYHLNRIGRFSSPDLLAGSLVNPQTLNRYTYVGNDPINHTDPTGLDYCLENNCPGGAGGPGGTWDFGSWDHGGMHGGAGVEACGVDTFCLQRGGIGPFGSPLAQIHCDSDGCMTGSWQYSQYLIGGSFSVDWAAQKQAEIMAAINKIEGAFGLIAENLGLDPNQQVEVKVQYGYGVWNVSLVCSAGANCSVDANQANATGWPDPITYMHGGNPSWYFDSLFGFDAGHLIGGNDPAGAHIDPFGPFNPLHYLLQMPTMLFPRGPVGYTTCSISGGCQ